MPRPGRNLFGKEAICSCVRRNSLHRSRATARAGVSPSLRRGACAIVFRRGRSLPSAAEVAFEPVGEGELRAAITLSSMFRLGAARALRRPPPRARSSAGRRARNNQCFTRLRNRHLRIDARRIVQIHARFIEESRSLARARARRQGALDGRVVSFRIRQCLRRPDGIDVWIALPHAHCFEFQNCACACETSTDNPDAHRIKRAVPDTQQRLKHGAQALSFLRDRVRLRDSS